MQSHLEQAKRQGDAYSGKFEEEPKVKEFVGHMEFFSQEHLFSNS